MSARKGRASADQRNKMRGIPLERPTTDGWLQLLEYYVLDVTACLDYFSASIWGNLILLVHKAKTVEWNCDKAEKQTTITKVIADFPLQNGTQTECQANGNETIQTQIQIHEIKKHNSLEVRKCQKRFVLMDFTIKEMNFECNAA